jgi:hypothetical protein
MAVGFQLSDGNDDGTSLGQSATDKVSLYGVTPIVQRSGAAQAVFTTTMTQSTGWGFLSSTAADAAVALLLEVRAALVALGAIKGSA